jgi:hypothetical protein
MRELSVKVAALPPADVGPVTRALHAVPGVSAVELDVSSGWVVIRGDSLDEDELLAVLRAAALVPERVQHDMK